MEKQANTIEKASEALNKFAKKNLETPKNIILGKQKALKTNQFINNAIVAQLNTEWMLYASHTVYIGEKKFGKPITQSIHAALVNNFSCTTYKATIQKSTINTWRWRHSNGRWFNQNGQKD